MWMHIPSTACDLTSFNGQGQLYMLTCAEWRDLSNHTRISTIQSRTPEKKEKNRVMLTRKLPWKSCSTIHPPFLSSNPKILKVFLKTLPTKMKPTKCPAKEKKWGKKSEKRGMREISIYCFLSMPELCKLIFRIGIRRLRSVRPVNSFVVSFSS